MYTYIYVCIYVCMYVCREWKREEREIIKITKAKKQRNKIRLTIYNLWYENENLYKK